MESIKALRKYFEAEGCQFVEFKDCHIQVSKGKTTINWWPIRPRTKLAGTHQSMMC